MRKFILSTERTSDLPQAMTEKYDIRCINMLYSLGNNDYGGQTGKEIDYKAFFDGMREGLPTRTAQVTKEQAKEFFSELLKTGKDIVHISFAGKLSGTAENTKAAAEELNAVNDNKIYVADSKCASSGQGLLTVLTAIYADEHDLDARAAYEYAESLKDRILHYFVVSDLKYLARGGRCTKGTAFIGNLLQIKPLLHVDEEGALIPLQKVISRKKSLHALVDRMEKKYNKESPVVFVNHADCIDDAKYVAAVVKERLGLEPVIMELGPVIGSHSGPGTVALFFTGDSRSDK